MAGRGLLLRQLLLALASSASLLVAAGPAHRATAPSSNDASAAVHGALIAAAATPPSRPDVGPAAGSGITLSVHSTDATPPSHVAVHAARRLGLPRHVLLSSDDAPADADAAAPDPDTSIGDSILDALDDAFVPFLILVAVLLLLYAANWLLDSYGASVASFVADKYAAARAWFTAARAWCTAARKKASERVHPVAQQDAGP